jgi:hypothetical protein
MVAVLEISIKGLGKEDMKRIEQWAKDLEEYAHLAHPKRTICLVSYVYSLLQQARQEARSELMAQLEAIVEKNTDKELGTTDYDGLAEGVLAWLAKWRKREK